MKRAPSPDVATGMDRLLTNSGAILSGHDISHVAEYLWHCALDSTQVDLLQDLFTAAGDVIDAEYGITAALLPHVVDAAIRGDVALTREAMQAQCSAAREALGPREYEAIRARLRDDDSPPDWPRAYAHLVAATIEALDRPAVRLHERTVALLQPLTETADDRARRKTFEMVKGDMEYCQRVREERAKQRTARRREVQE